MTLPTHGRFPFSALPTRAHYAWPGGKSLAFYVALNVETFGYGMPGAVLGAAPPPPDHRNWSWREYGNRVGFWRMLELFDEMELPAAHLVNSYLYDTHPEIPAAIRKRGDEFVGHGRTNSERVGGRPEEEERALIAEVTEVIARHEGAPPRGWMTPNQIPSELTPDLLQEAGYRYLLDWAADDQPFWMKTRRGRILSVPYPVEINDYVAAVQLHFDPVQFVEAMVRQFEELVEQSARQPLVCAISLHTNIFGQPHRLRVLREGLRRIRANPRFERVWVTRPGDIAAFCDGLPAGVVP
ncbi:MAG: polysaccharide deacetylase family protein [Rhodospirillaceae bacterium]